MKNNNKFPWTLFLSIMIIIFVVSPTITYLIALICRNIEIIPHIGSVDTWISFSGSIVSGSLTMLALAFTIFHEREIFKENEKQSIRPILFCEIKNKMVEEQIWQISLPNCVNNYDFIHWEISNVSSNVADYIRIIDEKYYIRNDENYEEIDGNLLYKNQGISIYTTILKEYISLPPYGKAKFKTNFSLETFEDGSFKTGDVFDFVNTITIEYRDVKGIGIYKSDFTFHININIDKNNKPCIFIESVSNTLVE